MKNQNKLYQNTQRGLRKQAVKVKKANSDCLDTLWEGGISVRDVPRIILYSAGPPFRW